MKQQNSLKPYNPNAHVLRDLLDVSVKYNLNVYEFEAEIKGVLKLLEKSQKLGIFENMKDIADSMKAAVKIKFGE